MASDKANPKMVKENICCFSDGFLKEGNIITGRKVYGINGWGFTNQSPSGGDKNRCLVVEN